MLRIAWKMLVGDRGKYMGIIIGIALASVIMIQQPGMLLSMLAHTYSFITDVSLPGIWVMDPQVRHVDDARAMQDTQLYRVRGVAGVDWAVSLYKGSQKVRLKNGESVGCNLLGLDDATLIGGPAVMAQGSLADLREPESVIVDESGARGRLAQPSDIPGQPSTPVRVGDVLEINDHRAVVVGIAKGTPSFMGQPVLYTTYNRAKAFALSERKNLAFILAQAKPGEDAAAVARRITAQTGLAAYTAAEFKKKSLFYMIRNTNILINFGFVVLVGFVIGAAVTGQIFYNFTLDNLRYFGVFKAMGAGRRLLVRMILIQALSVGCIGFGLGAGLTAGFAALMSGGNGPSMSISWQLLLGSGGAVLFIVLAAALMSIRKVLRLEAAVVFKG